MPPRSVKMKRFIFGFQRRVWWPKWTPASSNSFMETTGMRAPFCGLGCDAPARPRRKPDELQPPSTEEFPPVEGTLDEANGSRGSSKRAEEGRQIGRQLRTGLDPLSGDRMRER